MKRRADGSHVLIRPMSRTVHFAPLGSLHVLVVRVVSQSSTDVEFRLDPSDDQLLDHVPMHIREPAVDAVVTDR